MKVILLLILSCCCYALALKDEELQREWLNFKHKYGKKYRADTGENIKRFNNFKENFKKIIKHNELFEQNRVTYKMTINPFTDMDLKEIENSHMGLKLSEKYLSLFKNIKFCLLDFSYFLGINKCFLTFQKHLPDSERI